jgi:hypothetical protein
MEESDGGAQVNHLANVQILMAFLRPRIEHISFSIKPLRSLKGEG